MSSPRKWQGRNWLRVEKRLAIYLRDNMQCCYCGFKHTLTLDHVVPVNNGEKVDNSAENLITCCNRCNATRKDTPIEDFCNQDILEFINKTRMIPLNVQKAKTLIKKFGGFTQVLDSLNGRQQMKEEKSLENRILEIAKDILPEGINMSSIEAVHFMVNEIKRLQA